MRVPQELMLALLLVGCTQGRPSREQLDGYQRRSSAAATLARRCAEELRSLAEQHPREASSALAASSPMQLTVHTRDRASGDIAMYERELNGALDTIANDVAYEGIRLEHIVSAATQVHQIEARLCEARDVAFTLASDERSRSSRASRETSGGSPDAGKRLIPAAVEVTPEIP